MSIIRRIFILLIIAVTISVSSACNLSRTLNFSNGPYAPEDVTPPWLDIDSHYVAVSDGIACITTWDRAIHFVDITDIDNLKWLGMLDDVDYDGRVECEGNYAYITFYDKSLHIVDISNPAKPYRVTTLSLKDQSNLIISGKYAYIAEPEKFVVLDVSNPETARVISELSVEGLLGVFAKDGSSVYAGKRGGGVIIIDVKNPEYPEVAGFHNTLPGLVDICAGNGYTYVIDFTEYLSIFRNNPIEESALIIKKVDFVEPRNIELYGDYLVMCGNDPDRYNYYEWSSDGGFFQAVDVSDPMNPEFGTVCWLNRPTYSFDLYNGLAVVTQSSEGVNLIDISDPANPVSVAKFGSQPGSVGFDIEDGNIYSIDSGSGFHVLDFSPLGSAHHVTYIPLDQPRIMDSDRGLSVVGTSKGFLEVISTETPASPKILHSYDLIGSIPRDVTQSGQFIPTPRIQDIAVSNGYVYVSVYYNGLFIFKITNSGLLDQVYGDCSYDDFSEILVEGSLMYITVEDGIHIYDVTNPSAPELIKALATENSLWRTEYSDGNLYAIIGHDKIQVIDVDPPEAAHTLKEIEVPIWEGFDKHSDSDQGNTGPGGISTVHEDRTTEMVIAQAIIGVAESDGFLYVLVSHDGLYAIDLNPLETAHTVSFSPLYTSGSCEIEIIDNLAYIATGSGVRVIRLW